MYRLRTLSLSLALVLLSAAPVLADSGDLGRVQNFITNCIQTLVALAGLLAAGFFVAGGINYITSAGNPMRLEKAKQTLIYSAVGLAIAVGAFVLTGVVSDLATSAFK